MENQTAPDLNIHTAIARMDAAVNAASAECLPGRALRPSTIRELSRRALLAVVTSPADHDPGDEDRS